MFFAYLKCRTIMNNENAKNSAMDFIFPYINLHFNEKNAKQKFMRPV